MTLMIHECLYHINLSDKNTVRFNTNLEKLLYAISVQKLAGFPPHSFISDDDPDISSLRFDTPEGALTGRQMLENNFEKIKNSA